MQFSILLRLKCCRTFARKDKTIKLHFNLDLNMNNTGGIAALKLVISMKII